MARDRYLSKMNCKCFKNLDLTEQKIGVLFDIEFFWQFRFSKNRQVCIDRFAGLKNCFALC